MIKKGVGAQVNPYETFMEIGYFILCIVNMQWT